MRGADHQGVLAEFVGQLHPHPAAAQADAGDLADGLIPQRARDADRGEEVGLPYFLGARRPGADPLAVTGRLRAGRTGTEPDQESGEQRDGKQCATTIPVVTGHGFLLIGLLRASAMVAHFGSLEAWAAEERHY